MSDAAEVPSQEVGGWGDPEPLAAFLGSLADLIAAIAWPLALLTVLLLFKEPVERLLGRVKSAKAAGVDVDFGEQIASVGQAAGRAAAEAKQISKAEVDHEGADQGTVEEVSHDKTMVTLLQLLDAPYSEVRNAAVAQSIVLNAWTGVEGELHTLWETVRDYEALEPADALADLTLPTFRAMILKRHQIITPSTYIAIQELSKTRDAVALRGGEVEIDQALAYARSADEIKGVLRKNQKEVREGSERQ